MISINILGSCLSRDALWFDKNMNYEVPVYRARTSIVSNLQEDYIDISENNLQLDSAFQREAVLSDCHRSVFCELQNTPSDYLMVDFIDERFKIAKINFHGQFKYATYSNYLMNIKILDQYTYELIDKVWVNNSMTIDGQNLDRYLYKLVNKLTDIYDENQIIIHKAYMLKTYYDTHGEIKSFKEWIQNDVEKKNRLYHYMYSFLERYMPKAKIIDAHEEGFLVSEKHRWGLTPMHYEDGYYYEVLRQLREIVKQ